jgi:hypothetical protein
MKMSKLLRQYRFYLSEVPGRALVEQGTEHVSSIDRGAEL